MGIVNSILPKRNTKMKLFACIAAVCAPSPNVILPLDFVILRPMANQSGLLRMLATQLRPATISRLTRTPTPSQERTSKPLWSSIFSAVVHQLTNSAHRDSRASTVSSQTPLASFSILARLTVMFWPRPIPIKFQFTKSWWISPVTSSNQSGSTKCSSKSTPRRISHQLHLLTDLWLIFSKHLRWISSAQCISDIIKLHQSCHTLCGTESAPRVAPIWCVTHVTQSSNNTATMSRTSRMFMAQSMLLTFKLFSNERYKLLLRHCKLPLLKTVFLACNNLILSRFNCWIDND